MNSVNGRTYSEDDTIPGETCTSAAWVTAASHGWGFVEVHKFRVIHTTLCYASHDINSGK